MKTFYLTLSLILLIPCSVNAEGEASCEQTCAEGQVLVSFADGANARCVCQEAGTAMIETVETPIDCVDPEDDGSCE